MEVRGKAIFLMYGYAKIFRLNLPQTQFFVWWQFISSEGSWKRETSPLGTDPGCVLQQITFVYQQLVLTSGPYKKEEVTLMYPSMRCENLCFFSCLFFSFLSASKLSASQLYFLDLSPLCSNSHPIITILVSMNLGRNEHHFWTK